jgi:hypothetical protein
LKKGSGLHQTGLHRLLTENNELISIFVTSIKTSAAKKSKRTAQNQKSTIM